MYLFVLYFVIGFILSLNKIRLIWLVLLKSTLVFVILFLFVAVLFIMILLLYIVGIDSLVI